MSNRNDHQTQELIRRWQGPVYNLACRMLVDADSAADATQNAFIQVCRDHAQFDVTRPEKPWVFRIAVHAILNQARSDARRRSREREAASERRKFAAAPATPESEMAAKESIAMLESCLQDLPDEERLPLLLHYYHGESFSEIADCLEVPKSTVQTRVERALANMRGKLEKAGYAALVLSLAAELQRLPAIPVPPEVQGSLLALPPSGAAVGGVAAKGGALKLVAALGLGIAIGTLSSWVGFRGDRQALRDPAPRAVADDSSTDKGQEMNQTLPKLTRVLLASTHVEATTKFYETLFNETFVEQNWGMELNPRTGNIGGVSMMIFPDDVVGIQVDQNRHQLGFTVADIEAALEVALENGGSVDEGWTIQITPEGRQAGVRDPDGNSIEFFEVNR